MLARKTESGPSRKVFRGPGLDVALPYCAISECTISRVRWLLVLRQQQTQSHAELSNRLAAEQQAHLETKATRQQSVLSLVLPSGFQEAKIGLST